MSIEKNSGKAKAAFNQASGKVQDTNRTSSKGGNSSHSDRFTSLRPGMHGPKPPEWMCKNVNSQLHKQAQQRLAAKVNLQNQFAKAAHKNSGQAQAKGATLTQKFNQASGRSR